jgi:hypothetical protein
MKHKFEIIRKDVVLGQIKLSPPSWHLLGETQKNYQVPKSLYPLSGARFVTGTSGIKRQEC